MALYIHPSKGTVAVAVCDRCSLKLPYTELSVDGDNKGLRVCRACNDGKDPYKLPARKAENITLRYPRPDEDLEQTTPDVITTEYGEPIDFPPELLT